MQVAFTARKGSFFVLLAGLAGALPSSWAHYDDPPPKVTVIPVPESTTLSGASTSNFASYTITVKNPSDDKLGYLVLTARSSVPDGGGVIAPFVSSDGLATPCVASATDPTSAVCTLPPLAKYGGTVVFTLVYKAPTAGTTLRLDTTLKYAQSIYHHRKTVLASASTALEAPVANAVNSYVPATGGAFSTGLNIDPTTGIASATADDPMVTTVVVPAGQATTASILESPLLQSCMIFTTCYLSDIVVPGASFNFLRIYLTRDATTIPKKPKKGKKDWNSGHRDDDDDDRHGWGSPKHRGVSIGNVVLFYDHLDGQGPLPVPDCADDPTRPSSGRPCINSRTELPTKAPTPPIDQGDWRLEVWASDNGRYSW